MKVISLSAWILHFLGLCFFSDSTPTKLSPKLANSTHYDVECWITNSNKNTYLQKQSNILSFNSSKNNYPTIEVFETNTFQTIDGFGFTLTSGSVQSINLLKTEKRKELLQELFGKNDNSISISYLRISIGASDLNTSAFTYNDLPAGQTDMNLTQFSLNPDIKDVIPMLKEIVAINPQIKIMASPWSAPTWMKDNNSFIGGSLKHEYYSVYANYFVKYIQKMKQEGITITAITPQNEPLHSGNNPSMFMTALQQADFIKNHLGPAFVSANLATKIIIYDHNCDRPDYPLVILNDRLANPYIDGSAFHLYAGDINVLSSIHEAFPNKNIYFTEQYTSSSGDFKEDFKWHMKNVIIGSMRNWSKIALEWNLANDINFNPHTQGGCTTCKGGLTINGSDKIERNVAYYIIAHASKFVPTSSVRIASTQTENLNTIAFKTTTGKTVLIIENNGTSNELFNIKYNEKWITTSLDAGAVATFRW